MRTAIPSDVSSLAATDAAGQFVWDIKVQCLWPQEVSVKYCEKGDVALVFITRISMSI